MMGLPAGEGDRRPSAVRTTGKESFCIRRCRLQSRSNSTICPRSWNSRPWSHSSEVRLLGGTIGYKVDNRAAGLGLGSDRPWGTAEKAQWATEWPSSLLGILWTLICLLLVSASPWDGDTKSLRQVLTLGI